jgi:hypothetical protein
MNIVTTLQNSVLIKGILSSPYQFFRAHVITTTMLSFTILPSFISLHRYRDGYILLSEFQAAQVTICRHLTPLIFFTRDIVAVN